MLTFSKPLDPEILIARTGLVESEIKEDELITLYHYTIFAACLVMYPSLRYFAWSADQESKIKSACSPERIADLVTELRRRAVLKIAEASFVICCSDIRAWISWNKPREVNHA